MRKLIVIVLVMNVCAAFGQVNLPTGSATFSIPMFNWQDDKSRLNFLTGLNYNSGSGLKVNSVASNVGQGWEFLCGGVITRMQIGEPDDQIAREGTVEDITKYPNGYLYDPMSAEQGCPNALTRYPIFQDKNHIYKQHNSVAADRELDHFSFQFNGRSGLFILQKGSNNALFLGTTRLKAWYTTSTMTGQGIRTTIDVFYIQDENGLIYKFAQHDLVKEQKMKFCDANQVAARTQPNMKLGNVYYQSAFDDNNPSNPLTKPLVNPWIVTGWHLSEIQDPLTGRKVTFSYNPTPLSINNSAGAAFTFYPKGYDIVTYSNSKTQTPQLQSVTFPDGHQVVLTYNSSTRYDLNGDFALNTVDIMYQGRYMSEYQLTTSYFVQNRCSTPSTDLQKAAARLCLLSVRQLGADRLDMEPPYKFDYFTGSSNAYDFVPPPFFHMKDIWGYYNGAKSADATNVLIDPTIPLSKLNARQVKGLCFMRDNDPNPQLFTVQDGYAKNGLLKQVTYPTGGMLFYDYEQNKATVNGVYQSVGGVHVSSTKLSDGGFSNGCPNLLTTSYYYTTDHAHGTQSMYMLEAPKNFMPANTNNYVPESPYFYYHFPVGLGCDNHYKFPGILSYDQAVSLTANQQFWVTFSKVLGVVGSIMDVLDIVNVCLDATPAAVLALVLDVVGVLAELALSCTTNPEQHNTSTVYYNSDVNASNPLPVGFSRLEVQEGGGGKGFTVYEFTNPSDPGFGVWKPDNPSYSMEQRFAYWAYGQPRKITEMDATGTLKIKETENVFYLTKGGYGTINKGTGELVHPMPASCKCMVTTQNSARNDHWAIPSTYQDISTYVTDDSYSGLTPHIYGFYSGQLQVTSTAERTYKLNDQSKFQETVTSYNYSYKNDLPNLVTTNLSNGQVSHKAILYSSDYSTIPGVFTRMSQNNIINDVVSTYTYIDGVSLTNFTGFTDEKVTEFASLSTGAIKPWRTLEQRVSSPQSVYKTYLGPGNSNNPTYRQTSVFVYNAAGKLTGVQDEGGRIATNIYDYNDKYVTASVINSDPLVDKPAYTSFETADLGGWSLSGGTISSGTAVTGNRYLAMSGSVSLTASINPAKPYILSFWASTSTVTATGTRVKSAPTVNGWTYYEYAVPQGTSTVTVTGTGNMDELRLYPKTARMRTVTYDPLIGKNSECDENNRITYYEYDALSRLRMVKDENRNIVKMYEYNYARSNQTSCVTTYYNNAVSEIYYKQSCGQGKMGKPIAYTIPAAKYSSTISQAAADQQAQDELDNLAQAYVDAMTVANACVPFYSNRPQAKSFINQAAPNGYKGNSITYSVPAGRYISLIDSADADQQALDEIDANGQAMANATDSAWVIDTAGNWLGTGGASCSANRHMYLEFLDQNPNSPSYNQNMWVDTGYNASCPVVTPVYAKIGLEAVINGYGNVVARFYSDAACTQTMSVTNLTVRSSRTISCSYTGNGSYSNTPMAANGTSLTIGSGVQVHYSNVVRDVSGNPHTNTCDVTYFLTPGAYTIVN